MGEEFPRAMVMRGAKKKGTRYFGPYAHAWAIRETLDLADAGLPDAHLLRRGLPAGRRRSGGPACSATSTSAGPVRRPGRRRASTARIAEDFCDFMAGNSGRSSAG